MTIHELTVMGIQCILWVIAGLAVLIFGSVLMLAGGRAIWEVRVFACAVMVVTYSSLAIMTYLRTVPLLPLLFAIGAGYEAYCGWKVWKDHDDDDNKRRRRQALRDKLSRFAARKLAGNTMGAHR